MLIVLSPAKSLDFTTDFKGSIATKPIFQNEASHLIANLKKLSIDSAKIIPLLMKSPNIFKNLKFQNYAYELSSIKELALIQASIIEKNHKYENEYDFYKCDVKC